MTSIPAARLGAPTVPDHTTARKAAKPDSLQPMKTALLLTETRARADYVALHGEAFELGKPKGDAFVAAFRKRVRVVQRMTDPAGLKKLNVATQAQAARLRQQAAKAGLDNKNRLPTVLEDRFRVLANPPSYKRVAPGDLNANRKAFDPDDLNLAFRILRPSVQPPKTGSPKATRPDLKGRGGRKLLVDSGLSAGNTSSFIADYQVMMNGESTASERKQARGRALDLLEKAGTSGSRNRQVARAFQQVARFFASDEARLTSLDRLLGAYVIGNGLFTTGDLRESSHIAAGMRAAPSLEEVTIALSPGLMRESPQKFEGIVAHELVHAVLDGEAGARYSASLVSSRGVRGALDTIAKRTGQKIKDMEAPMMMAFAELLAQDFTNRNHVLPLLDAKVKYTEPLLEQFDSAAQRKSRRHVGAKGMKDSPWERSPQPSFYDVTRWLQRHPRAFGDTLLALIPLRPDREVLHKGSPTTFGDEMLAYGRFMQGVAG